MAFRDAGLDEIEIERAQNGCVLSRPMFCFLRGLDCNGVLAIEARLTTGDDAQQIVGRERRESVSQLDSSGDA
jgi:hypothetical protein